MNTTELKYTGTVNFKLKLVNGRVITLTSHNKGLPDFVYFPSITQQFDAPSD